MKFVLYLACATSLIATLAAQQSCNTPRNRAGVCVNINECPSMRTILNNQRRSKMETALFSDSLCNRAGEKITSNAHLKVCCEVNTSACVSILQCPSLLASRDDNLLAKSSCIGDFGFGVHCPQSEVAFKSDCGREATVYKASEIEDGESQIDQFPWVALIEYYNRLLESSILCSATLISSRYVLTAAQCFHSPNLGDKLPKYVVLGEYDFTTVKDCNPNKKCNDAPLKIGIEEIISHPNFTYGIMRNDIALVRMKRDVGFTEFVRPICLPQMSIVENFPDTPTNLIISGWNLMINGVRRANATRKLSLHVPAVKRAPCQAIYDEIMFSLLDEHVCAGGVVGMSSCAGDSGIPLMRFRNDHFELVGVLSYGAADCGIHVPNLYTDVFAHLDWIRRTILN